MTADLGPCPPGCVEHYTGPSGWRNHSTAPRYVTGASATREDVVSVGVWLEQREKSGEPTEVVGIVEKHDQDVELSAVQLRELARHLLEVASLLEEATAAVVPGPVVVAAVSGDTGPTAVEVRAGAIAGRSVHLHTGTSGEDLMLSPGDARRLGEALIRAAG